VNVGAALVQALVFPGLLYALVAGFFLVWGERKIEARVQRRIGPPFYQPFFDVVKLFGKKPVARPPLQGFVMGALPVAAAAVTLGAAILLPVLPGAVSFPGDLVLFVALIEAGPLFSVLGGFASRSTWGGLGANREAVMTAAYNLPFLTALVALAWHGGLSLAGLETANWPVRVLALVAVLICLPAKLHVNPFSIASAEQEIYRGPSTEYDGWRLAFWEIAHGLEWVVLTGLVAVVVLPGTARIGAAQVPAFLGVSLAVLLLVSLGAAATARLKLAAAARSFWLWALIPAVAALVVAAVEG